jgi:hypothetical protein
MIAIVSGRTISNSVPSLYVVAICTRPRIASRLRFTTSTPTPRIATDRDRRDHLARIDDLDLEAHARDELRRPRRGVEPPLAPRARQARSDLRAREDELGGLRVARDRGAPRRAAAWISARKAGYLPVWRSKHQDPRHGPPARATLPACHEERKGLA